MATIQEVDALLSDDVINGDEKDSRLNIANDKKAAKILERVKVKGDVIPIDQTPFEAPDELVEGDEYKGLCFMNENFERKGCVYKIIWSAVPFTGSKDEYPDKVEMKHLMYACEATEDGVDYDNMLVAIRDKDGSMTILTSKNVKRVCRDAMNAVKTALKQGKPLPMNDMGQITVSFNVKNKSDPSGYSTHIAEIPYLPKFVWDDIMNNHSPPQKTSNQLIIQEEEEEEKEEEKQKNTKKTAAKKSETPQRDEQQQRLKVAESWKGNKEDYGNGDDENEESETSEEDGDYSPNCDVYDSDYDPEEALRQKVTVTKERSVIKDMFNTPDCTTEIKNRKRLKKKMETNKKPKPSAKSNKKQTISVVEEPKEKQPDMVVLLNDTKSKESTKSKPKSKPKPKQKPKPRAKPKGSAKRKREEESEQDSETEMDVDEEGEEGEESEMDSSSKTRKSSKGSGYTRERQKRSAVIHTHLNHLAKRYKEVHGSDDFPDPFEYLQDVEDVKTFFEKLSAEKAKPLKEQFHFLLAYLMNYTTTRNSLHPLSRPKKKITKKSKKEPPSAFAMSGFDFD